MTSRESFTDELVRLGHLLELRLDQVLRPVGLTARQFCALRTIAEAPRVSRAAAGLVERPALDPGRPTQVRLTRLGRTRLAMSRRLVADTERSTVALLRPDTAEGLLAGVRELLIALA